MRDRAMRFARWVAIFGLWLLIGLLVPLTWITRSLTGGGLRLAEWAQATSYRLRRAG